VTFKDKWFETYDTIAEAHYRIAEHSVPYRVVSLLVFAIFAPMIQLILWLPYLGEPHVCYGCFARQYVKAVIGFYRYIPDGLRGKRRDFVSE
jgi:hypothetical protein